MESCEPRGDCRVRRVRCRCCSKSCHIRLRTQGAVLPPWPAGSLVVNVGDYVVRELFSCSFAFVFVLAQVAVCLSDV